MKSPKVNTNSSYYLPWHAAGVGETFKMWGDFLLEMLEFYRKSKFSNAVPATRGSVLCHNLIGVLPEYPAPPDSTALYLDVSRYAQFNIGVILLGMAITMAKERGYHQVITIATHIASQKLSEKLGFNYVGQLEYLFHCNYAKNVW